MEIFSNSGRFSPVLVLFTNKRAGHIDINDMPQLLIISHDNIEENDGDNGSRGLEQYLTSTFARRGIVDLNESSPQETISLKHTSLESM